MLNVTSCTDFTEKTACIPPTSINRQWQSWPHGVGKVISTQTGLLRHCTDKNTHTVTPVVHTCTAHSHARTYTYIWPFPVKTAHNNMHHSSCDYTSNSLPHPCTCTHTYSCEWFVELGHEHENENKSIHAEEIGKARGERQKGRGIEREIHSPEAEELPPWSSFFFIRRRTDKRAHPAGFQHSLPAKPKLSQRSFHFQQDQEFSQFAVYHFQWAVPSQIEGGTANVSFFAVKIWRGILVGKRSWSSLQDTIWRTINKIQSKVRMQVILCVHVFRFDTTSVAGLL